MTSTDTQPSTKWHDQWVELQGQIYQQLPNVAHVHHCHVLSTLPKVLTTKPDGTEMTETSIDFIHGEKRSMITILIEGFPNNGFALSIFSRYAVVRSSSIFQGHSIDRAVRGVMADVGRIIERIKMGASETPFSIGTAR